MKSKKQSGNYTEIYNDLIENIPEEIVVKEAILSPFFALVRSKSIGIAFRLKGSNEFVKKAGCLVGQQLRKVASYIDSWNYNEAALGLACINSYYNSFEEINRFFKKSNKCSEIESEVSYLKKKLNGKKVAFIGHLHFASELKPLCDLSILEMDPHKGDYPSTAAEYILSDQDYVVISATSLINKTLPRILELSSNARKILIGPSLPITPIFFDYGVDTLCGRVVLDEEKSNIVSWVKEGGMPGLRNHNSVQVRFIRD